MPPPTMDEPIALIGYGARFPGGCSAPSKLWSLIENPVDISSKPPPSRFDIDPFYHPVASHHGTTNATKAYWLVENIARFDAPFFNIQAREADSMDPQQRLLMEVTFDALYAAGQPMEQLQGSDTAVYVGMMCDDWHQMLSRDWQALPRYTASSVERGIMANRISYFFDWHGPSMTIDTACSSSMVALDLAVQALRSGKSKVAVAAGSNLILSPSTFISESNLGMLSSSGRCAMWDASADGYARGEGVAAVIIKTLSQALADNDPIQCIIRGTAVNQDGRTSGLTAPSGRAQAALISECYRSAGLDPVNCLSDRPQYCHAHGTGTQAGDPQEAEAIATAFFPHGSLAAREAPKLMVGSVKTVIGHTEGTAGLASVISTALALQNKVIPPNLHFKTLNPSVAPFFDRLEIPTVALAWPVAPGQVRRASVNSFGFGGANAHCILEEYTPPTRQEDDAAPSTHFSPLVFSAASEAALRQMLLATESYLHSTPNVDMRDLAYTLQHRRSTLPYRAYRAAVAASWIQNGKDALEMIQSEKLGIRHNARHQPARVLGIFTGQGAQWPRMGAQLVEKSPFARSRIAEFDAALQTIENLDHCPTWSIYDQLVAQPESSRVTEAAVSQPLSLAVQILLVDILRAAGISLTAVVGHSSGELGAAYAAGMISAADAIRVAYLRGLHTRLAASPNPNISRGAMVAVGISAAEGKAYCNNHFAGRLDVAAENSPSLVTLSGDEDAVTEAIQDFQAREIFSRRLKVDTAYHSVHMLPCAGPFLDSLNVCGIQPVREANISCPVWFSTVFDGEIMSPSKLTNQYWIDNMCNPVLFKGALAHALEKGPFDLAIEIGPHPALKGPAASMLDHAAEVPYTGLIHRGRNDIDELSSALGYIWTHLGANSVQFSAVERLLSGTARRPTMLEDLPPYPFDHTRDHWHDGHFGDHSLSKTRTHPFNTLLGFPCLEAATPGVYQWRNILRPSEVIWLSGHRLQGQTVFPAMGYISAAVEALRLVLINSRPEDSIQVLQLAHLKITRAMVFDTDDAAIETIFSLSSIIITEDTVRAKWACYSKIKSSPMALNAQGCIFAQLGSPDPDSLKIVADRSYNLVSVDEDHFYSNLSRVGYNYLTPFRGVSNIQRKPGYCVSRVINRSGSEWEDNLTLHPGMLDSALQTIFAAWSYPGDGQIWSLHAPVSVASIIINPYFTALGKGGKQHSLNAVTSICSKEATSVVGDVFLHTADASYAFARFEGVSLVPVTPATPAGDKTIFARFENAPAFPESEIARAKDGPAGFTSSASGVWGSVSMQDCSVNKLMVDSFHYEGSSSWDSAVAECVSHAVLSISHRYPRCDICEINGGAGDTTLAVLDAIEGRHGSYTFTDPSAALVECARERLCTKSRPLNCKVFSIEENYQEHESFEGSYDIIVAVAVRPNLETVESSSSSLGRLLKPGGFLLSVAATAADTRAGDVATPTAPVGHNGFERSLPLLPLLSLGQWDTALKANGFAGVDAIFPAARTSQEFVLFVAQAADHRVRWLRSPLSFEALPTGVQTGMLVIIGGTTWPVVKLAEDIAKLAAGRFCNIRTFSMLEDYAAFQQPLAGTLAGGISILSLTDLDEPYLAGVTPGKFEALKACFNARTVIWATCGSQEDRPYSYMMTGIARTIKSENPTMHIQIYGLDPNLPNCIQPMTATDLTNALLQQVALGVWGDDASLLWTAEPEVYVRGGRLLIPRLVPDHEKNARYNSRYRDFLQTVDPHSVSLELAGLENGKLVLRQLSPLAHLPGPGTGSRTLRVTHSVLQTVFAGSAGFLRVCAGIEISTGDPMVALTISQTTPAKVPAAWCISVATPPTAELLVSIAAHLVAVRILSYALPGSSILLHGVDAAVERAVQTRASKADVNVISNTATGAYQKRQHSIHSLHHKPMVPREISLFVNFAQDSRSDALSYNGILETLPPACLRLEKSAFLSHKVASENISASTQIEHVANLLQEALGGIQYPSDLSVECIPLDAVFSHAPLQESLSVVDWTASETVTARVQPIDSGIIFRDDRSYLLVGMAGAMGQSIAGWMIAHGARHIVLSSRTPNPHPKFIEEMRDRYNAKVVPLAMDITSRESLRSAYSTMQATLPPIAGLVNGAMVLQDALFTAMTHEQFVAATAPKVQGTILLDDLFYRDNALDFFVVASSISCVIGWAGQANYSAANQFMTALVTQRRKRGVPGFAMHIPAVLGIGQAAESGTFDFEHFQSLGHVNIGEEDLHTLFAEAILSGRPGKEAAAVSANLHGDRSVAQVVMGIDYTPPDTGTLNTTRLIRRRDAKFNHFVTHDTASDTIPSKAHVKATKQHLRSQLQSLPDKQSTYAVIRDALVTHLRRILRLAPENRIDESTALIDQSVDSLVAMDIRAWFLSEVDVDAPTLLIMGGASVTDLVSFAVERLHEPS
ncbi:hypothetical protein BJX68DRAFT_270607 [Aspergillus pseudodeflectus]|uniref:Polyketide synthase n=1 Tax=Aspergillus pseudodeflectus TaxID=176178 RepID=A0ABR4JTK0_9EURO